MLCYVLVERDQPHAPPLEVLNDALHHPARRLLHRSPSSPKERRNQPTSPHPDVLRRDFLETPEVGIHTYASTPDGGTTCCVLTTGLFRFGKRSTWLAEGILRSGGATNGTGVVVCSKRVPRWRSRERRFSSGVVALTLRLARDERRHRDRPSQVVDDPQRQTVGDVRREEDVPIGT